MTTLKDCDKAWINVNLATMDDGRPDPYGLLYKQALGIKNGQIACITPMSEITATRLPFDVIDAHHCWMTPGLIDCHTHLVYGGHRAQEFEQQLQGITSDMIKRQGGGIMSTVRATRVRSIEQLIKASLPRLQALCSEGSTMVEITSGYGLSLQDEIKILTVARKLQSKETCSTSTTLLTAFLLPPEFAGRSSEYIQMVCSELIPEIASRKLADAIGINWQSESFTDQQCLKIAEAARASQLPIKTHTRQSPAAVSLITTPEQQMVRPWLMGNLDNEKEMQDIASSGSVAVLMPGSYYLLQRSERPPIELFRQFQIPMAIATNLNPGTSPLASIRLMMNMACILFRLAPAEALAGVTREAAKALGKGDELGIIAPGRKADLCLWDIDHPAELSYQVGTTPLKHRIISGEVLPPE